MFTQNHFNLLKTKLFNLGHIAQNMLIRVAHIDSKLEIQFTWRFWEGQEDSIQSGIQSYDNFTRQIETGQCEFERQSQEIDNWHMQSRVSFKFDAESAVLEGNLKNRLKTITNNRRFQGFPTQTPLPIKQKRTSIN
jgi:hypothetical protein